MLCIKRFTTRLIRPLRMLLALLCCLSLCPDLALATNVEDSLVVGIESHKTVLIDPLNPLERDIMSVYDLVYESMVVIDDDYIPQPGLAESWEVTGGGKTWTFTLRENITFSDGSPLTAKDVVATAQHILDLARDDVTTNNGYYVNLKYFIADISAKGDNTVIVKTTDRPCFGLLYAMTFPVLPASQVGKANPTGSGPYVITTFEAADYIWLQANPNWWQTQPQVKEIMFLCHETPQSVIQSYEYAQVDTIFTRSIAAAQHKSGTSSLALDYRSNQLETLLMNHSSFPLNSINVRKAIRLLVDPDKIAKQVYMGMVERTDTPMIPGTWMYNDTLSDHFVTDVEAARELLAADGWFDNDDDGILDKTGDDGKKKNLHLRIYVYEEPDNNVRVEAANLIADMLRQVGISTTIETMTLKAIREKLDKGSFDLALASFAMDTCPDPGFLLISGNTGNYGRYRSSEMTELCRDLRKCVTREDYQATLMSIQARFAEDCPFICLYYRTGSVLTRRMYTTARDVRELELLRGIETFHPQ